MSSRTISNLHLWHTSICRRATESSLRDEAICRGRDRQKATIGKCTLRSHNTLQKGACLQKWRASGHAWDLGVRHRISILYTSPLFFGTSLHLQLSDTNLATPRFAMLIRSSDTDIGALSWPAVIIILSLQLWCVLRSVLLLRFRLRNAASLWVDIRSHQIHTFIPRREAWAAACQRLNLRQCAEESLASFTKTVELPQLLFLISNQRFQIIAHRPLRCSRTHFHLSSKLSKTFFAGAPSLCKANSCASRQGLGLTIPQAILKVQRKAVPLVVQVTTQVNLNGSLQQSANGFWPWLTFLSPTTTEPACK